MSIAACGQDEKPTKQLRVDLLLFGSHPLLLKVQQGLKNGVETVTQSSHTKVSVIYVDHDADFQTQESIQQTKQALRHEPAAIVAFGTPSIKAAISLADGKVPVFFGATSDPVAIGVAHSNDPATWDTFQSGGNVFGLVTDFNYRMMSLLIAAVTDHDKSDTHCINIGYPMNDAEPNSVLALQMLQSQLDQSRYCLISATVATPLDVPLATRFLLSRDAVLIQVGPDNTVVGAIGSVVSIAHDRGVPVLASDSESVRHGADAAYAVDFYQLGTALGVKLANYLLQERPAAANNIQTFSESKLYLNEKMASTNANWTRQHLASLLGLQDGDIEVVHGN